MTVVRAVVVVAALAVGLVFASAAAGGAGTDSSVAALQADGSALYQTHCAACHQADGSGVPGAFPPLAGNPAVGDAAYVERVIVEGLSGPLEVLGVSYDGMMPAIALGRDDLAALVAFVQTFDDSQTPPPTTAAPPSGGDEASGEALFKGAGFTNGGAACHACHSAGAVGFRGGSGLGPDLTDVYERLGGEAGLSAWLSSPPSETMRPLYEDKPLTSDEIGDLTAFFAAVVDDEPSAGVDLLIVGGLAGLLVLLGFMALVVRKPRETYTKRLRSEQ